MWKNVYLKDHLKKFWLFCSYIAQNFLKDSCLDRAASLTFTSLLSLVPLMVVGFAILSVFPMFSTFGDKVQDFIFTNFIASSGEVIQEYLKDFSEQAMRLSILGLIFLVITAVLLMFSIEQALNSIWRVKIGRRGFSAFFRYWAVLTFSPFLIGIGIIISTYLFSLPVFSDSIEHIKLLKLIPSLFTCIGFLILYMTVPNCRVKWRDALVGAIVATVLFELTKRGFAFYVKAFPTYQLLYGAFSAVPIFLIWVYLSWIIVLLGAEICHARTLHYQFTSGPRYDGFTQAYHWLGYLWQAQQHSRALSIEELVAQDNRIYEYEPIVMMNYLLKTGYVDQNQEGDYLLRQDLQELTLYDFYERLPWRLPEVENINVPDSWQKNLAVVLSKTHSNLQNILNIPLIDFYQNKK